MRFSYTDEQQEFRRVVRRFLEERSPAAEVRRQMETERGWDPELWGQLSGELALAGVHLPEDCGGQGFGFEELCIALQEAGRALLCAPLFASSVLAAEAIRRGASEPRRKELLPGIASGETIATLAWLEGDGRPGPEGITLEARPHDDGSFALHGQKRFVLDGHSAERVVVVARAPGTEGDAGLTLFCVDGQAPGLERRALATLDQTRKQAQLDFDGVRAEPLGEPGSAGPALEGTLDRAAIALANEAVGGAERVLEMAVDYAKTRVQFGVPIGSFQAIKHKCADMLLDVELARSAAAYAAAAVDEDDPELPALASLALSLAADAYRSAAAENIQIHGGIGFTWEHDAHLYFKRAKGCEVLLGDPAHHRERLARSLGV